MVAFGKYLQRKQIEEWSGYAFSHDISVLSTSQNFDLSSDHLILVANEVFLMVPFVAITSITN